MRWVGWVLAVGLVSGVAAQEVGLEVPRGAVSGKVMTVEGDPVEGAVVQAVPPGGETQDAVAAVMTDDRGMYRLYGLRAGSYKLRLAAGVGKIVSGTWFYPAGEREGRVVVVEGGSTVSGTDFLLPQIAMKDHGLSGESVSGGVEEWVGGAAVSGALVELKGAGETFRTRTDRSGQFRFVQVPVGQYRVVVWSAGHLREVPDSLRVAAGTHVVGVEAGKAVADVRVRLMRGGVLTGRVSAEGEPVVQAIVSTDRVTSGVPEGAEVGLTDDRGEFRIYGMVPGKYYVAADAGGEGVRGPVPTFFPDTVRFADAVAVRVGADGTAASVNLEMLVGKKRTVRGVVRVPEGATMVQVRLRPTDPVMVSKIGEKAAEVDEKAGAFVATDVWPGEYEVVGVAQRAGGRLSDVKPVNVRQGDQDGVLLELRPLLRIHGEVRTDGVPACDTHGLSVQISPREGGGPSVAHAAVMTNGAFTLEDVTPGSYRVGVSGMFGTCYAKAVQAGAGADMENLALMDGSALMRVTLGNDGSRVRGEVVDGEGKVMKGKRVVLVASGASVGREELTRRATTNAQGQFIFEGIAFGTYDVFELSDEMEDGEIPASGAQSVEVRLGEEPFLKLKDGESAEGR